MQLFGDIFVGWGVKKYKHMDYNQQVVYVNVSVIIGVFVNPIDYRGTYNFPKPITAYGHTHF